MIPVYGHKYSPSMTKRILWAARGLTRSPDSRRSRLSASGRDGSLDDRDLVPMMAAAAQELSLGGGNVGGTLARFVNDL